MPPQLNPPSWPRSVLVFGPEDHSAVIEEIIDTATAQLKDRALGHFSDDRVALLFKPGRYDVDINVGYYTQVLGLGAAADDVIFCGARGIHVEAMDKREGGAGSLDTFWRCAENFQSDSDNDGRGLLWAVSQAAPLRRVRVSRDLTLHDGAFFASGGFAANVSIAGALRMGSQQQWFARNSTLNPNFVSELGGAWSFVFTGCSGAPPGSSEGDQPAVSVVDKTPVVAEKPYITIDPCSGRYTLRVPRAKFMSSGSELGPDEAMAKTVDFSLVLVADANVHGSDAIQAALDAGLDVILSPGIFLLSSPLVLKHPGQVLLGLGMATLLAPPDGSPCVRVLPSTPGIRVAGIMLQASMQEKPGASCCLLEWGSSDLLAARDPGEKMNPGVISDLFCRVGGPDLNRKSIAVETMVKIFSGNVIGDNIWLWRADHSQLDLGSDVPRSYAADDGRPDEVYHLVTEGEYWCKTGLEVRGNDVTMLGLAVEHTCCDQTLWYGDRGETYFYQCELPYDATQRSFGDCGFAGYVVDGEVSSHKAVGIGVYSFFRDEPCMVPAAIRAPQGKPGVEFEKPFIKRLNGHGSILSVLNYPFRPEA